MKKKINVGLVGTGRLGKMYAEFLTRQVSAVNLVAVADLIPERADDCAALFEVPHVYYHHQDLNADKDVEAVIVKAGMTVEATPTSVEPPAMIRVSMPLALRARSR